MATPFSQHAPVIPTPQTLRVIMNRNPVPRVVRKFRQQIRCVVLPGETFKPIASAHTKLAA